MAFIYSFSTPKLRVQGVTEGSPAMAGKSTTEKPKVENFRTFTSAAGDASFEGVLVGFDHRVGLVRIRQRNGRTIDFEIDKLSETDQKFLLEGAKKK